MGSVWGLLGIATAMLLCVRWSERSPQTEVRWTGLLLAGLALGSAAAERPNLVLLLPAIAGWCVWRTFRIASGAGASRPRLPALLRPAVAIGAGACLPLLLVTVLNFTASGEWIPLATSRGLNLYIGNHPGAVGTYDEPWAASAAEFNARHSELEDSSLLMASKLAGRTLTPEQASGLWTAKALDYIRSHPGQTAAVTARKAALLLNNAEVPNHLNFTFLRERAPALWLMPVGFGVVFALAVAGVGFLWAERRRRGDLVLLLLVAAVAGASVLPFFVTERYRAPLVPSLLVLAGAGAGAIAHRLRRPRSWTPRALRVLGAATAAACFSIIPLSRPYLSRDYWMFAQAYAARGDLPAAAHAYEAAVQAGGDDGELLNNLGLTYRALGRRDRAEAALRRATRVAPALAYPHKNLGMLLISNAKPAEAMAELTAAARIEPDDAETQAAIGALYAERGDRTAAAAAFARSRRLAPGDARLARLIRHYLVD